jgi:hypothetical protein
MHLSLSAAAAPALPFEALFAACRHRGLAGIELPLGAVQEPPPGGHAVALRRLRRQSRESGVAIVGLAADHRAWSESPWTARMGALLSAPVTTPAEMLESTDLARLARRYAEAGARLVITHGSDPDEVAALRVRIDALGGARLGLGWEVRPGTDDLETARQVIEAAGPLLEYVRLHGGGPEAARQTGQGIGALMARLTLARYIGPLVLTPSTPRYRQAWSNWLLRGGGWGCGSKSADGSLVQLIA